MRVTYLPCSFDPYDISKGTPCQKEQKSTHTVGLLCHFFRQLTTTYSMSKKRIWQKVSCKKGTLLQKGAARMVKNSLRYGVCSACPKKLINFSSGTLFFTTKFCHKQSTLPNAEQHNTRSATRNYIPRNRNFSLAFGVQAAHYRRQSNLLTLAHGVARIPHTQNVRDFGCR